MSHGFDSYYGIPYSNDMDKISTIESRTALMNPRIEYFQVPLMRNADVIERPADQTTSVKRYTQKAVNYINANKRKPFFLYMAHSLPHVPLFVSDEFKGQSERGLYGDVIQEIAWSVGQILNTLRKEGLDKNTYVIFTSDNDPWVVFDENSGSAGPLFGGKRTGYEGGVRVPAIFWGQRLLNWVLERLLLLPQRPPMGSVFQMVKPTLTRCRWKRIMTLILWIATDYPRSSMRKQHAASSDGPALQALNLIVFANGSRSR